MLPRGGWVARYTPPMRPRPFTLVALAAAASAVWCVAACGRWARSYSVRDRVQWEGIRGGQAYGFELFADEGSVTLYRHDLPAGHVVRPGVRLTQEAAGGMDPTPDATT